jgi:type IV pilus assembly protein PilN
MVRINLLPREEKPSKSAQLWGRIFMWSLIAAVIVMVVGLGLHFMRSREISTLKYDIEQTRVEQDKYKREAAMVTELTEKRRLIAQRIGVIEGLDRDRYLRVQFLEDVARSVPEYVWLESFSEVSGNVSMRGNAFSNLAISRFMDSLEAKASVDSVYLRVIRRDQVDDTPVLNFEVGYQLTPNGKEADRS